MVLISHLGRHFDRHFGIVISWQFILRAQLKFEPNRFINGSIIGHKGFEPPSWQPSCPSF